MPSAIPSLSMTISGPRLRLAEHDLKGRAAYGLPFVFQVSPTQAAVVANLRLEGLTVIDYEAGSDVFVFDALDRISPAGAQPLERNETVVDPQSGESVVKVRYPPAIGFVPLGAKLADGRPHPHAGTGFGISSTVLFPADPLKARSFAARRGAGKTFMQFRFDGRRFEVTDREENASISSVPGWWTGGGGMSVAIPDGEDLLMATSMATPGGGRRGGVARWRRADGRWRIVELTPITGPDGSRECSLAREANGSLVFSVRGAERPPADDPELRFCFRIWRSTDNGRSWQEVLRMNRMRPCSPVTINRTVSGWPFLAANPHPGERTPEQQKAIEESTIRERLWFWPMNADRTALGQPVVALDGPARFGPAAKGKPWYIDHPTSTIVRLGDGQLHCVIGFRVCGAAEVIWDALPSPHSGAWIEEVRESRDAPPVPIWRF